MDSDIDALIENIKQRILDENEPLVSILLSIKALANNQNNGKMMEWVKREIDGYKDEFPLPDYRIIDTRPEGTFISKNVRLNRVVLPYDFLPESFLSQFFTIRIFDGVSAIQENINSNDNSFHARWPFETVEAYNHFGKDQLSYILLDAYSPFRKSHLRSILASVRSRIQDYLFEIQDLDWSKEEKPEEKSTIYENLFIKNVYNNTMEQNLTTFDQRGQHVHNQYNAGRDINFNENMSPIEFAGKLGQIVQQLDSYMKQKDGEHAEDIIQAKADLEKAKFESIKQEPDQSKIQSLLTSAKNQLSTIADLAQITELLIAAITYVSSLL